MNLKQLAKKPQLVKITIDDEDIVKEFGESLEFWTWDRQPMETFLKLSTVNTQEPGTIINVVRELILDEDANPIITNDVGLPTHVMMRVVTRVVEGLGK